MRPDEETPMKMHSTLKQPKLMTTSRKRQRPGLGIAMAGFAFLMSALPAAAASYTLNFTGTVTGLQNDVGVGIGIGDTVAGSLTVDGFNTDTFLPFVLAPGLVANGFPQVHGTTVFHVDNGGLNLTVTKGSQIPFYSTANAIDIRASMLKLHYAVAGTGTALTSLAGFP
jgi:hypothetical protein